MFPNIKAEIARNDMNYRSTAAELGVSVNTLKNWLSGRTEIPASKILKMARLFNCRTDYLLGYEKCEQ